MLKAFYFKQTLAAVVSNMNSCYFDRSVICSDGLGNFMEGWLLRKKKIWSKFLGGKKISKILTMQKCSFQKVWYYKIWKTQQRNAVTFIKLLYGLNILSGALIPPSTKESPKDMFDNYRGHVTKAIVRLNFKLMKVRKCQQWRIAFEIEYLILSVRWILRNTTYVWTWM